MAVCVCCVCVRACVCTHSSAQDLCMTCRTVQSIHALTEPSCDAEGIHADRAHSLHTFGGRARAWWNGNYGSCRVSCTGSPVQCRWPPLRQMCSISSHNRTVRNSSHPGQLYQCVQFQYQIFSFQLYALRLFLQLCDMG